MDFFWSSTERQPGQYDFSASDRLMDALDVYGLRALFILDYSNRLYDDGLAPHTDEGRQAFAQWTAAGRFALPRKEYLVGIMERAQRGSVLDARPQRSGLYSAW